MAVDPVLIAHEAEEMPAAVIDDDEGDDRAERHQPLDPEIEHARALHHQFAEGGEQEGRGGRQHAGKDELDGVHGVLRAAVCGHSRR